MRRAIVALFGASAFVATSLTGALAAAPSALADTATPAAPTHPACQNARSGMVTIENMRIVPGQFTLENENGYYAKYLANGVFQVIGKSGQELSGQANGWITVQVDGNLVLYNHNGSVNWASNTRFPGGGNGQGGYLTMQCDGNLVLYGNVNGKVVPTWWLGTNVG